jgi:hypothetical protein
LTVYQRSPSTFACETRRAGFSLHDVGCLCAAQGHFLLWSHAGLSDPSPHAPSSTFHHLPHPPHRPNLSRTRQNLSEALGARFRLLPRRGSSSSQNELPEAEKRSLVKTVAHSSAYFSVDHRRFFNRSIIYTIDALTLAPSLFRHGARRLF